MPPITKNTPKMKTLLTSLVFLYTCLISAQNLIDQQWEINRIFGTAPQQTDFYILQKGGFLSSITFSPNGTFQSYSSGLCAIGNFTITEGTYKKRDDNYIGFHLKDSKSDTSKNMGKYYVHKVSDNEVLLIKSTGNLAKDQQRAVYATVLAPAIVVINKRIYKDPKMTISSSTPWLERVNKYVTEVLKLSNYEICLVGCDSVLNTIYLVKDSDKEAYSYILEQSSKKNNYTLQHLTEDYIQQEIAYWKDFYNKQTK